MLLLLVTLALAETATPTQCRIDWPSVGLSRYIGISQKIAANGGAGKLLLYGKANDPEFGSDKPIRFLLIPSLAPTLTVEISHHEPVGTGNDPIEISEVKSLVVIDLSGNVQATSEEECEDHLRTAEGALRKMQEVLGP